MPTAVAVSVLLKPGTGSLRYSSVHDACSEKMEDIAAGIAAWPVRNGWAVWREYRGR